MYSKPQKMVAEFVGTFALIFMGCGAICADQLIKTTGTPGGLGLFGIAAAFGLAIAIMVTAVGHISGGHLNPAVTIGFWVSRRLGTIHTLAYWVAQLAGATFAAYLLTLVVPKDTWQAVHLGTPSLAADYTRLHGMTLEAALTFLLVFVVFATAADSKGAFDKI